MKEEQFSAARDIGSSSMQKLFESPSSYTSKETQKQDVANIAGRVLVDEYKSSTPSILIKGLVEQQDILRRFGTQHYAEKYGITPGKLFTIEGIDEVLKKSRDKGMGDKLEWQELEAARAKLLKKERLTYSDFQYFDESKIQAADFRLPEARNQKITDSELKNLRQQEEQQPLNYRQAYGDPNGQANGFVTNQTLKDLAEAVKNLVDYLKGKRGEPHEEARPGSPQLNPTTP